MKSTFNILLICCAALFLSQCDKDEICEYVYALPTGDEYMFDEGELLLYQCSDGTADTFLVEHVNVEWISEEYPEGGLFGSSKMCTYRSQECIVQIRNLNNFWEASLQSLFNSIVHDSSSCFQLRFYGSFYSDHTEACSWIESGCDGIQGHLGLVCQEGLSGETIQLAGRECTNVFSEERLSATEDENGQILYKVYWNLTYGIIRFEDRTKDPILSWDLAGRI